MTAQSVKEMHQNIVRKLTKNPESVLHTLDFRKTNMLHASIGIMDEYFELEIAKHNQDDENILEELGDLLFYTECLIIGFEDQLSGYRFIPLSRHETYQTLTRLVKRHIFYNQEINLQELFLAYSNLKAWIGTEASEMGVTIIDVQKHNMEKLAKRYPNFEFSNQRAKDRADKKEGE